MRKLKLSPLKSQPDYMASENRENEHTHGYPRCTPRYDLRKMRTLPDEDIDEEDPDLKKED